VRNSTKTERIEQWHRAKKKLAGGGGEQAGHMILCGLLQKFPVVSGHVRVINVPDFMLESEDVSLILNLIWTFQTATKKHEIKGALNPNFLNCTINSEIFWL